MKKEELNQKIVNAKQDDTQAKRAKARLVKKQKENLKREKVLRRVNVPNLKVRTDIMVPKKCSKKALQVHFDKFYFNNPGLMKPKPLFELIEEDFTSNLKDNESQN